MKAIRIKVNGVDTNFNAKKLRTDVIGQGINPIEQQDWIPKDEASDYLESEPLVCTYNGVYRIKNPGETTTGIISIDENGIIEYVVDGDCIRDFNTDVSLGLQNITISENGVYVPTRENAKAFRRATVNVQPKTVRLIVQENGTYRPQNCDGYDCVIVDVKHPIRPEEYINKYIDRNGTYRSSDQGSYGYDVVYVNCKKDQVKTTGWQVVAERPYSTSLQYGFFDNAACTVYRDKICAIKGTRIVFFETDGSYSSLPTIYEYTRKPCVVTYKDKIWVFYHQGPVNPTSVWTYSPEDGWELRGSAPSFIQYALVHEGKLYAISTNAYYKYDDEYHQWIQQQFSMPYYTDTDYISYEGLIYNFGSGMQGNLVYAYNTETGVRTTKESTQFQLKKPRVVVYNGSIRAIGYEYNSNIENKHQAFTDEKYNGNMWRTESFFSYNKLPIYSDYMVVGEMGGELYAIGRKPGDGTSYCVLKALEEEI